MATEEKRLTSSEIDELLKEVEHDYTPIRTTNRDRKKKPKIRIDMIIAAVLALVIVVGVVTLIVHFVNKSSSKQSKTTVENPLKDEMYPEISDVVKNYLNAFLIEDDNRRAEIIAQYVGNLYDINSVKQKTYISSYSEIECYTKKGPYDNTYIVYAYYQMNLKNINTPAPTITRLYVVRDTKTGKVYIQNDSGKDIQKYMNQVTKDADVQQLLKDTEKEFEAAKKSDPQLKSFYDKIEEAKKKRQESQTSAQPQTTQTQAQTTAGK